MARIRTIKPEFYRDERIADLSYAAAFHFPGLWLLADRAGRLRDRPREIKAELAPLRKVDMEEVLTELATAGLILRYSVNGVGLIQVNNLERHQRFNNREPESSLPPPNSSSISAPLMPTQADLSTHVRAVEEGKGMEGNMEGKGRESSLRDVARKRMDGFDSFWAAYRKKSHRQEAEEAWRKLRPAGELQAQILLALTWQFRQARWLEEGCQYAPNPATYLNGKRWLDEPSPASTNGLSEKEARNLAAAARFIQAGKVG